MKKTYFFKPLSQKLNFTDFFGTVSKKGYQTLTLKGHVKFTINSFNLQCFAAQLLVWKTMILKQQLGQTIFLSMLVFVISGTWGYRSGLEMMNVTYCG